jgi:hypothetical protein
VDPVQALSAVKTVMTLAEATGLVRSATSRALAGIDATTRGLLEAPLHEGLERLDWAAECQDDPLRQLQLLDQARSRFHDAVARPGMPGRAVALARISGATVSLLMEQPSEAQRWMQRALNAYDDCCREAYREVCRVALVKEPGAEPRYSWRQRITEWPGEKFVILRSAMSESADDADGLKDRLSELCAEITSAHVMAKDVGVAVVGRCAGVTVIAFRGLVVRAQLQTVT